MPFWEEVAEPLNRAKGIALLVYLWLRGMMRETVTSLVKLWLMWRQLNKFPYMVGKLTLKLPASGIASVK